MPFKTKSGKTMRFAELVQRIKRKGGAQKPEAVAAMIEAAALGGGKSAAAMKRGFKTMARLRARSKR